MARDKRRYSRHILFPKIGAEGQELLSESSVVLIGCGGLGCAIAAMIVRAGIKKIRIVDRDYVEEENLLHQTLYTEEDARCSLTKAKAAQSNLRKINAEVQIEAKALDVHSKNIEEVIGGSDVVMDGTDNFETRYLINDACIKLKIPWIYGAVAGSRGMCTAIVPDLTPCFRCIYPQIPPPETIRTCDTEGVFSPVVHMVSSLQVSECLKLLTNKEPSLGELVYLDAWKGIYTRTKLTRQDECPTCQKREYPALKAREGFSVNVLCGRNTVLITYFEPRNIDCLSLANKLRPLGNVKVTEEMLLFRIDGYEMAVFPDGRAIIKGTEDPNIARTIYSRYIGN